MQEKITVGSMFAGIGGICLGFKQNGCELVWANEIDKHACKTYRLNFGDSYLVEGDIQKIDTKSIPKFDILTAGFPCQAFSSVGLLQGFDDPRGNLFFETDQEWSITQLVCLAPFPRSQIVRFIEEGIVTADMPAKKIEAVLKPYREELKEEKKLYRRTY